MLSHFTMYSAYNHNVPRGYIEVNFGHFGGYILIVISMFDTGDIMVKNQITFKISSSISRPDTFGSHFGPHSKCTHHVFAGYIEVAKVRTFKISSPMFSMGEIFCKIFFSFLKIKKTKL